MADMEEESNALIKISATTFVLKSIKDLIVDDSYSPMNFRVQWELCLSELFTDEMDNILDNVALIASVLGSVARIYEALRRCEVDVGGLSRAHFVNHRPASFGKGFIETVCSLFPEIGASTIFQTMTSKALRANVSTCTLRICKSIRELVTLCGCSNCSGGPHYQNCLVAFLFFLRSVAKIMAHTAIDLPISPTQSGPDQIYSDCLWRWKLNTSRDDPKLLELACDLPHTELAGQSGKTDLNDFLLDNILQGIARVLISPAYHREFGVGPRGHDEPQCTAVVKNGVCLCIDALRDLSADPSSMATVHVAPGQIVHKNWNYASIWDLAHAKEDLLSDLIPACFEKVSTTTHQAEPHQPHDILRILAQERAESGTIRLAYGFSGQTIERTLQPGILTEEILLATSRVPCAQGHTCSDEMALSCWQRKAGWKLSVIPHPPPDLRPGDTHLAGFIWNAFSPLNKLLAIEGCRTLAWYRNERFNSAVIMVRSEQCMACMTRYIRDFADKASWEHILYYRGKLEEPFTRTDLRCSFHII